MPKISKVKAVKVWTTTDGKTFDDFTKAQRRQAELWFLAHVDGLDAVATEIVDAIAADREGFADDVGPVFAKPRAARADAGAPRPNSRGPRQKKEEAA